MTEVFVYVEGPSDQLGMRELLHDVIAQSRQNGKALDFYPLNNKETLLNKGPQKALNILRNRPHSRVFLVPDLYPRNSPFPHSTYSELKSELDERFRQQLQRKNLDPGLADRFHVYCFKHDFEALLLASGEALLRRLHAKKFSHSWNHPVEDQYHNKPPKRIVEALFRDAGMKYKETIDAPWILQYTGYRELMRKCPQNFAPFMNDLLATLGIAIA